MTDIYIISGFLGAGKTTLIQKLLEEKAFANHKTVLIENDFGQISIDAALLKNSGIEIREMNSGCICCSLSGDFVKSLKEILKRFQPGKIIIEPSGVGKLSDIIEACTDPSIQPHAKIKRKITVVDVKRCEKYLDNFGEFFEDQIVNADIILLSHVEDYPDKIDRAKKLVENLDRNSTILSRPWSHINIKEILSPGEAPLRHEVCRHEHSHDHDCGCSHSHSADSFDTITLKLNKTFSLDDLQLCIKKMEHGAAGEVLRMKGIIHGLNGYMNIQYIPGDLKVTGCDLSGNTLCIIGKNLNPREFQNLFVGK